MRDHGFNFTADPVSPLVEFPSTKWNRIYKQPPPEQTTTVNLRKVGDLGETVVQSLTHALPGGDAKASASA